MNTKPQPHSATKSTAAPQPVISAAGFASLQSELAKLQKVAPTCLPQRARLRLAYLQKRLRKLQIVHIDDSQLGSVHLGAWLKLAAVDGTQLIVNIVGYDELGRAAMRISVDSALARALMGKRVGDIVVTGALAQRQIYKILAIAYNLLDSDNF